MTVTPHATAVAGGGTATRGAHHLGDAFVVRGGTRLTGTVRVSGAKNSALKLFAAALLAPGTTTITNVPRISDTGAMADVVRHLGAHVEMGPEDGGTDVARITVPEELGEGTTLELAGALRASLATFGPLMARMGRAWIAQPGGCNLGSRGVDLHLKGMEALGATVTIGAEHFEAHAPHGLVGADFELEYASVGATENLVMAATMARGTTTLRNVAREPEISDLVAFLNAMGARIDGAGSPELRIEGTDGLHPCTHRVVGDRIEAGTFAVAAAMTGGDVTIEGVDPDHLARPMNRLEAAGVGLRTSADSIRILPTPALVAADVSTLPFPGFPTDMLAQFEALLTQATGESLLTENVYEGRFALIGQLQAMGADLTLQGHHIVVRGPRQLRGTTVRSTDLRAGAALVLAGLVAEGETIVTDPYHIDRGYAEFLSKLRHLGADLDRVNDAVGDLPAGT